MTKTTIISVLVALLIVFVGSYVANQNTNTPESSTESETTTPTAVAPSDDSNPTPTPAPAPTPIPAPSLTGGNVTVYDGITVPSTIEELNLSGRNLSGSLKAEVRQLTKLRVLDISDNNFTGLPAEVGQLSQLEVLDLSNNPFTGLPHELGNLQNLTELNIRGTQYSTFDLDIIEAALPASTNIVR